MAIAPVLVHANAETDVVQYLGWYWVWSRACLEVIAHSLGVELEAPALPEADTTRFSSAHNALTMRLKKASEGDGFSAYEMDAAYRCSEYLRRVDRYGGELERNDLDEVGALVGGTFNHWKNADLALEAFIESAGPERDADLLRLLHRRTLRHESLLQPVLRELEGVKTQMLNY
jgi:hypothetical protein